METVTIRIVEDKLMVGTDTKGHSVVIGKSPEDESVFLGIKPSDLLLMAAASCSAYDVVDILKKQREPFEDLRVLCRGEQQSEPPYTFTEIHLHYQLRGDVNPDKLERAIRLSEEKYCSVIASLRPGVLITSDYKIIHEHKETAA